MPQFIGIRKIKYRKWQFAEFMHLENDTVRNGDIGEMVTYADKL